MYLALLGLVLANSFAHIVQVFQILKKMEQEWMPVFIFGLIYLGIAIGMALQVPYILWVGLVFGLLGGIGQGSQIMRLDSGGCVNRLIVILTLLIIALFGRLLVVGG